MAHPVVPFAAPVACFSPTLYCTPRTVYALVVLGVHYRLVLLGLTLAYGNVVLLTFAHTSAALHASLVRLAASPRTSCRHRLFHPFVTDVCPSFGDVAFMRWFNNSAAARNWFDRPSSFRTPPSDVGFSYEFAPLPVS